MSRVGGVDIEVSEEDEYIDYFKYHVKWSPVPWHVVEQDEIRPINNYMHPADKEIQRLVMPLCGTRTFASKMREQLCYVDEDGHLQPRRDVQWPAFLRYNASKILTKYGKNAQGNDLLDLFSLPAEKVLGVDSGSSKSAIRARERQALNDTAGPGWFHFPKTPDLAQNPELRKDLKMLTHRANWDPHQRYKSLGWIRYGANTSKTNRRVSYPKFLQEGFVVPDRQDASENLPRALRYKSLTEQVLSDATIRKRLLERFGRRQLRAGGRRARKGEDVQADAEMASARREHKKQNPPKKVRTGPSSSLAQLLDNHELAKARRMMHMGNDGWDAQDPDDLDTLHRRKMPIMPSQGGSGKEPTAQEIREESLRRAGKRVRKRPRGEASREKKKAEEERLKRMPRAEREKFVKAQAAKAKTKAKRKRVDPDRSVRRRVMGKAGAKK